MAIEFACPLCGKQTVVADQFAGQTGPCASCGGTITIPRSSLGAKGPTGAPGSSSGASVLFVILAIVGGGALLCCGAIAVLFFMGRSQVQVATQRQVASNHLKMIGLALHSYHDTHGTLPPAVVTDADGKPLYSGRVLLLPFLEQPHIYDRFDKTKAWDAPENQTVTQSAISVFQNPANQAGSVQRSDFLFVTGTGTMFEDDKATKFGEVRDGMSNTIMVVETTSGPDNWAAPTEWNAETGTFPSGAAPQGTWVLFGDGSVHFMTSQYGQQNQKALASKSGSEVVPPR